MNKKLFLIPLAALLLVGCNTNKPASSQQSEQPKSSEPAPSSSEEPAKEWTQVTPVAGKKYKLAEDVTSGRRWLTGVMDGFYMGSTTDVEEAADVELVAVTGGFNLKVTLPDGETVKYVNLPDGKNCSPALFDTATTVWKIGDPDNTDAKKKGFVEKSLVTTFKYTKYVEEGEVTKACIGTQSKYETFTGVIEKYWDPASNACAMFMELK